MASIIDEDRPLKFALVGFGRVADRHCLAMDSLASTEARWVAVCDVDAEARQRARQRLDVPTYDSFDVMLERARPDVAVLATPSGLHPMQTVAAAKAGVHVVTEKPMATRWGDGKRMVEATRACGTRLFVVKQQRHGQLVQTLARTIRAGRFGRIYNVQLSVLWTRPQDYYDLAPWRGTWELDGGALMNQAIHYIDLLQWLVGPIESVDAYTATLARNIEVEDTATLSLRWRNGALGSVSVTMLAPHRNYEAALTIVGEHGVVRLGGVACNQVDTWRFDDHHADDELIATLDAASPDVYGSGHVPLYENIIASLRGKSADVVDGAEGLKSLELVVAAYRSAQQGRRVSLPLEP